MKKIVFILFTFVLCFFSCIKHNKSNGNIMVEEEILKIAKDTAIKVYGYITIMKEYPLKAKLIGDTIWEVRGTLPKGFAGGTVCVKIKKSNKKVVKVTHYK